MSWNKILIPIDDLRDKFTKKNGLDVQLKENKTGIKGEKIDLEFSSSISAMKVDDGFHKVTVSYICSGIYGDDYIKLSAVVYAELNSDNGGEMELWKKEIEREDDSGLWFLTDG